MRIANFGVEEWLNVWEKDAVHDIAQSTIASFTLEEILRIDGTDPLGFFEQRLAEKLNYGWIEGSPEFKELAAGLYENVDPDCILQTNGGTGANLLALYALVEPGDHVVAMYPSYQQLYDIPRSFGADVSMWQVRGENGWVPDVDELEELIRPDTKLICLNNANNPTGTVIERDVLTRIVEIADRVGAYILVDEVFRPLDPDVDFVSIVDLYERGIATHSLSKTFSVPGVRVGWTATGPELADTFRTYRDYTLICAGVLDDAIAVHTLKNKDAVLARNREIVSTNLGIVRDWLATEPRVDLVLPKSVSVSFIRLDIPIDVEEFCLGLLRDQGVLLVPGTRFDVPGHARLGYCAPTETLRHGLAGLSTYLRTFD